MTGNIHNVNLMIQGDRPIREVQKEFSNTFPFLKIEFFRNGSIRKDRYPLEKLISPGMNIKDAWSQKKQEGNLQITGDMTVLQLEKELMDRFCLSGQVFRRSGNLWLETTLTDHWTLDQQNDHGREISSGYKRPPSDEYDYD